ncbi:MAG: flagellar basal body rod protein FlgB [Pseudomonadota bacterium]
MEIKALQHNEQALRLRALRNQVLSANIANADTPNYKARDIDFTTALNAAKGDAFSLRTTSDQHVRSLSTNIGGAEMLYRVPMQPALDGNTVETDVEQAAFAENALQYRTTLRFLDGQIRSIKYALKGGE